jgi:hypothetical protein
VPNRRAACDGCRIVAHRVGIERDGWRHEEEPLKARRWTEIVVGATLCAAALGNAWAQYPGGGNPATRGAKGGGQGAPARDPSTMASVVDSAEFARGLLLELEADLKLTPAQRPLWRTYATRVQQLADDVARNRNALRFPNGTAPEQLDFVAETLRNRLTAIEDVADAGKALYAALTAGQKEIADNRLARIALPLVAPVQATARGMRPGEPAPDGARGR